MPGRIHLQVVGVETAKPGKEDLPLVADRRGLADLHQARDHAQLRGQETAREHAGDVAVVGRIQRRAQHAVDLERGVAEPGIARFHRLRMTGLQHLLQRIQTDPVGTAAIRRHPCQLAGSARVQRIRQHRGTALVQVVAEDRDGRRQAGQTGIQRGQPVATEAAPAVGDMGAGAVPAHPLPLLVVVRIQIGRHRRATWIADVRRLGDRLDQAADIGEETEFAGIEQGLGCGECRVQAPGLAAAVGHHRQAVARDAQSERVAVGVVDPAAALLVERVFGRLVRDQHVERVVAAEQEDADQRAVFTGCRRGGQRTPHQLQLWKQRPGGAGGEQRGQSLQETAAVMAGGMRHRRLPAGRNGGRGVE